MSEWKTYKLGDIAKVIDSLHKTPTYTEKGYPMVRVTDLKGGYLRTKDCLLVSEDVYLDFSRNHKSEIGDIVISRVGSYGITSYVNEPIDFCLGQNTAFICSNGMDSKYLFYYLNSPKGKQEIEGFVTGSTQKTISLKSIKSLEILAPGLPTQRQIAQILSSLDDKIELNLQMNQTLEAMAQAVFKEWFVDFKFPGFDGEMVNGLPKGWRIGSLSEIISFVVDNRGKTPNTLIEKENNYPLIEVNSLINSRVVTQQHLAKKYVDEETYNNWFRKGHPKKGDVLFSTVGSIGEISLVFDEKFCIAQNIIALRSFFNGSFLFFALKNLKQSLLSLDISSVQPSIKVPHLLKSEILIPNDEIIKAYEESILPIIEKINENSIQIQTLTQTRDTLLPKLMSGKISLNCD